MRPYNTIIQEMIPGETSKEKYENLKMIGVLLQKIAYPRRGTNEEQLSLLDFAREIQTAFSVEQLEIICDKSETKGE